MSRRQILMVLGVWVMILCGPGFPNDIKQILAVVTGALIIVIAYRIKPDPAFSAPSAAGGFTYVEHRQE